jgi:hypothetical protein
LQYSLALKPYFITPSRFAFIAFAATHIIVDVAQTIQQKKKDTFPLLAPAPIRVNSTGGILTLLLIRL